MARRRRLLDEDDEEDDRRSTVTRRSAKRRPPSSPAPRSLLDDPLTKDDEVTSILQSARQPARSFGGAPTAALPQHAVQDEIAGSGVPSMVQRQDAPLWGNYTGETRLGGRVDTLKNVDPRLRSVLEAATTKLPEGWRAEVTSGFRNKDPRFHGQGQAIDVQLIDNHGRRLPNYQNAQYFREYEQFAQAARQAQLALHPDMPFRWGGYFWNGGKGNYGNLDLMHFDVGGVNTGGGSWEGGVTPQQAGQYPGIQSVGMRVGAQTPTFSAQELSPFKVGGQAPRPSSGGYGVGQAAPSGGRFVPPLVLPQQPGQRPSSAFQPQAALGQAQNASWAKGKAGDTIDFNQQGVNPPLPPPRPPEQGGPPLPPARPPEQTPPDQPGFRGPLADRQPGAPPVVAPPAQNAPQRPLPTQWSETVHNAPAPGPNENVAQALRDQALREGRMPWAAQAGSGEPSPGIGWGSLFGAGANSSTSTPAPSKTYASTAELKPGHISMVDMLTNPLQSLGRWFT